MLLYYQARIYMTQGEMESSQVHLEQSLASNRNAGMTYLVLNGLAHRGAVLVQTQGVIRAREALESAIEHADRNQIHRLPAFASLLYQLGRVHFIADDLDAAESLFDRAVNHGGSGGFHEARYRGLMGLACVRTAQRRYDDARALLDETEVFLETHQESVFALDTSLDLERRRLALFLGNAGLGPPVVLPEPSSDAGLWTTHLETDLLLRLQAALQSASERDRARALAQQIEEESTPAGAASRRSWHAWPPPCSLTARPPSRSSKTRWRRPPHADTYGQSWTWKNRPARSSSPPCRGASDRQLARTPGTSWIGSR